MNLDYKLSCVKHLQSHITRKIKRTELELNSLTESRNGETKSTAGDKHETGRALIQTEIDNLQKLLNTQYAQNDLINEISTDKIHVNIGFGSLVRFNNTEYLIAIGLGKLVTEQENTYFAISTNAPIFQEMRGKTIGENISFNGVSHVIEFIC